MLTKFPDTLHSVIPINYKCFTSQKITELPKNHWTGTSFVKAEKSALVQKDLEINLFWLCICYQSILLIIKNTKHLQNIGIMYTKELSKEHCYFEDFHRKSTKQPEIRIWVTSYETFNIYKHWRQHFE